MVASACYGCCQTVTSVPRFNVVWLEEAGVVDGSQEHGDAITDGGPALDILQIAANGTQQPEYQRQSDDHWPTKHGRASKDEVDPAIITLLQRSWFQRIWVRRPTHG